MSTSTIYHLPPRGLGGVDAARLAILVLAMLGTGAAVVVGSPKIAAVALGLAVCALAIRALESWPVLLTGVLMVILLIPIRRYKLPGSLPFDVEPYRIVVLVITLVWLVALLVDPRIRLRRTALDLPIALLFVAVLASVSANIGFIVELGVESDVVKAVSFFTSFLLVFATVVTIVVERSDIERLVRVIVVLTAFVSFFGIVEYHTRYNVFNHLSTVMPFLEYGGDFDVKGLSRSGELRVYGSAQHPIAYAGALVMVLPLALYLAQSTRRRAWWVCVFLIGLGALASLSRTGVVAIVAMGLALLFVRPTETRRLIPLLAPALVVVFLALPNALGAFKSAFFPQGGIVEEQAYINTPNQLYGNGRLADIGPTLDEWRARPIFGRGYGSRIVEIGPRQNAAILDNQWLDVLLELGLVGLVAFGWAIVRSVRRLGRIARGDPSDLGLLAGSLAASIVSFAVAIVTYDALGYAQVAFLFFVVLAIGASLIALSERRDDAEAVST